MSFEDNFPSLKDKELIKLKVLVGHQLLFDDEQISTYCLDKQKVKEVIEKLKKKNAEKYSDPRDILVSCYDDALNDMEKELGL